MTGALDGIRILDMSRQAPGPFCTMILGDLGADVILIEEPAPRAGFPVTDRDSRRAAYNSLSRNKRSIGLNLKDEEAQRIFYKLAETADVVLEGYRPGVVKRLGVDYETLAQINPRIICCSLSGYGQDGPYQSLPGHDINYLSISGALGLTGHPDSAPVIPGVLIADFAGGGMHAALGILAALMARERTGRGQHVDIAMLDGVLALVAGSFSSYWSTGVVPQRGGAVTAGAAPHYNVYRTKDGKYLSIGNMEPWFWENMCRALGREDLIPKQQVQGEERGALFQTLREIFATRDRDDWVDLLRQHDVCVAPIYDIDEAAADPHVQHRMVIEVEHPELGKVKQIGVAVKLSDTPGSVRHTGPLLGEHTEEILGSLGYDAPRIAALRTQGAIR